VSGSQAGKGSKVANNFRTPQWEESKLWDEKKIKNTRIFNENQLLINGSNVEIVEDRRYVAYIHYEYLCERYDRTLPGALNKHNEWIPHQLGLASINSIQIMNSIIKRYDITHKDLNKYFRQMPPLKFERLTKEYKRLVEPYNIQIDWNNKESKDEEGN